MIILSQARELFQVHDKLCIGDTWWEYSEAKEGAVLDSCLQESNAW